MILLALYVSSFANATEPGNASELRQPALPKALPQNAHIALLLPLNSPLFGDAADAVRQGFIAASSASKLPVRVYGCLDEEREISALYALAIANGARAVVGPLTRSGVLTLQSTQNISVPTLVLNNAETSTTRHLYYFGMAVENEAQQIAQLATQQGFNQAIVINTPAAIDRRLQFAFEAEWVKTGGTILREIEFNGDPTVLGDLSDIPDTMVFIAADAEHARLIRPYILSSLPLYSTSQIFAGNHDNLINFDLSDIHFVDMPWLLQVDHAAVMTYTRADPPLAVEHERLYALGIDAYRLMQLLLSNNPNRIRSLDGVTGQIKLDGQVFQRYGSPAIFIQGQAQLADQTPAPKIQMFPEQPVYRP